MTFSSALDSCIGGAMISRTGWNGKDMFVFYSPGNPNLPIDGFWSPAMKGWMNDNGLQKFPVEPLLNMKTAQGTVSMGWRPTSADMLADDWSATPY